MVQVSQFNLSYNPKLAGGDMGKQMAGAAAEVATGAIISALMGNASGEVSRTSTETTQTATDLTTTQQMAQMVQQQCQAALQNIISMVQSGEMSIDQLQMGLDQVIGMINDNNAVAEELNKQIETIFDRNNEIMEELEALDYDTTNIMEDGGGEISEDGGETKGKGKSRSPEDQERMQKIRELIGELHSNNAIMETLSAQVSELSESQTTNNEEGDSIQQQVEDTHGQISEQVQNFAQQSFQQSATQLSTSIMKGTVQQGAHATKATAYTASDTAAAITLETAAAGEIAGTLGFGAGDAAKKIADAALLHGASASNGTLSGVAMGNTTMLQTLGSQVGQTIAQNITNYVNQQLQGAITQMSNELLGEDVAQYVDTNLINELLTKTDEENA